MLDGTGSCGGGLSSLVHCYVVGLELLEGTLVSTDKYNGIFVVNIYQIWAFPDIN